LRRLLSAYGSSLIPSGLGCDNGVWRGSRPADYGVFVRARWRRSSSGHQTQSRQVKRGDRTMGRKHAKQKPAIEVGERYDLVRIGDTYFLKGGDGVLRQVDVLPISEAEARRLMDVAGIEEDQQ
jgi:hypothetical protein